MQRPKTQYTRCGDLSIAYQVFGDGPVDLLYAQGWLTHVEYAWENPDYARFLRRLAKFSRVIFFDKRGTGMSDREVGFPTLEQRSEDIESVLNAVGSDRAVLFGSSEGGNMSCFFAAQHPERVTSLALFGCFACRAWKPDYPWGRTEESIEALIQSMRNDWGTAYEDLMSGAPSVAGDPAALEWLATYFRYAASPQAAERITRLNYQIDVRGILPAIQCPTLIMRREGDRWTCAEDAEYLARHIPGAELRVLPGEDHMSWWGDQDSVIGSIEEFATGARSIAAPSRTLLTILMTDIVGSTERAKHMGDGRWRALLEGLDGAVDRRVAAFNGERVKHTGDGYLLAFSGPSRAIECAFDLGHLAARLGLELRTGIHTGECERRGGDLSGLAVHIASRIMDEAAAGTTLVSSTVKDLSVGSGFSFRPEGDRTLRDLEGHWALFSPTP